MALNDTLNTREDRDFFEELYSESVFKQVTIGIFFFGSIVGAILLVGIVWYERNGPHRYRTVLNQLFSTISWISICYLLLVYVPEGIRYLSFWITLIKRMSVGRRSLNYFMCAGKNPNDKDDEDSTGLISTQYDTTGFLVLVSFILHIIISVKIFVYEHI